MRHFITPFLALLALDNVVAAPTDPAAGLKYCSLPNASGAFETADGHQVNVDQTIANKAIADAASHGNVSVKIFRNNCLFASSQALYPAAKTDGIPQNIFSATKAVISILAGIAHDRNLLNLDDPIGKYLPLSILNSWGDAAHRAITIRQLLTETAGQKTNLIVEAITVLQDPSLPQQALAEPLVHTPGSYFAYSQRVPDLLAYIVSRAVNQELQAFAQANLFTPLGIPEDRYVWFRDLSGNTYGYAWLYLTANDFSRIGLFMQNGGVWNGVRILSEYWVNQVAVPSPRNGCYGFLFWTNQISPTAPDHDTCVSPTGALLNRSWFPSAPRDLFAMAGAPKQKNYMIPSLNMTISFMSVLDGSPPGNDTFYQFFKTLMTGIQDPDFVIPGPGSYEIDPVDAFSNSPQSSNLTANLTSLITAPDPNPGCNSQYCIGQGLPGGSSGYNVGDILGQLLGQVGSAMGMGKLIHNLIGF